LQLADGESVCTVEDIHCAIWPRTGGRAPEEFSDDEIALLGRLLARIHNVGAGRDAPQRPRLDAQSAALAPLVLLEERGFLPAAVAARYRDAVEALMAVYEARSAGVPVHRIHGDCHAGNLLRGDDGWFFLDFDDFVVGPAVHDVWMLLPGRDAQAERQRALLVEAYRQMRDFDPRWLQLVETLRGFRFVTYAAWIARRWDDPAFPAAFPHFGTPEYWEREALDLERQLEQVQREDPAAPDGRSGENERQYTNEDYFWDL
jgi:Ser/Thr protein kinase RdoA (MazF antagonist)